ncbi:MAG: hypothetical protein A2039_07635 [Candidatus Melainabacteria bacterium GWA2_34_9]|nr:MAG: hypothetical protein A2039_07635 [Candidatus Melainabacteria bacterium GWA2_34_9]
MNKYVAPEFEETLFTCPHCGGLTSQFWQEHSHYENDEIDWRNNQWTSSRISTAKCSGCENASIWYYKKMIYPVLSTAPLPHDDMPENVKNDYLEAREILLKSPRGACALLRLALEKLCNELVEGNQNLNCKIGKLVKSGLSSKLQKAFDFVRITGNDAVHSIGELDVQDNPEIAQALFTLINIIIKEMITEPKEVNELFSLIPGNKLEAIEKRDTVK